MTLVELIVALGIVGVALAVILGAVATGARGVDIARSQSQAVHLAISQMDYVKGQPFVTAPTSYAPGVSIPTGFTVSSDAKAVADAGPDLQRIVVTIARQGKTVLTMEGLKVNRP